MEIWFAAVCCTRVRQFTIIESKMISIMYKRLVEKSVIPPVKKLKLKWLWTMYDRKLSVNPSSNGLKEVQISAISKTKYRKGIG